MTSSPRPPSLAKLDIHFEAGNFFICQIGLDILPFIRFFDFLCPFGGPTPSLSDLIKPFVFFLFFIRFLFSRFPPPRSPPPTFFFGTAFQLYSSPV